MPSADDIAQIFPEMEKHFIPEKANGVNALIQFDLTGGNGGLFWIKILNNTCQSGTGEISDSDMTIRASADDYWLLVNGELNPIKAFTSGRIKVQGDIGLALKLQSMFAR